MENHYDVIVVGGSVGGAAAAVYARELSLRVVVLEGEEFPRFQIGESLLPASNRILHELGVWERIESEIGVRKEGAEFTFGDGEQRVHNRFSEGMIPGLDYTFQVDRSRFDKCMLERAKSVGATVLQPARAKKAERRKGLWVVTLESGSELTARWLLDASGRKRFLARQMGMRRNHFDMPARVAVYSHFKGVARASGARGGNIIITRLKDGWGWSIPIDSECTSIGVVSSKQRDASRNAEQYFWHLINSNVYLRKQMSQSTATEPYRVTEDYSFWHDSFSAENAFMIGDAAAFIDPIFSSGVCLSLESAKLAVQFMGECERKGQGLGQRERKRYEFEMWERMGVMLKLVRVFYDDTAFSVFMNPSNKFQLFAAVNSIVAGNTRLPFALKWRYHLFLWICRLNRRYRLVPPVEL